jgi:NAD(P)-dependent dehydrogenase (short-subunit alcohol dehydrogenase family)
MAIERRFERKVAFVTGGNRGIGRATALACAAEGARVVVAGVSTDELDDAAHAIDALGVGALAMRCDVTSSSDIEAAFTGTVETFGRLDLAFNNAGTRP